ncbi:eye-specific diacylglycerol kinase-like protein, partial [Leptotrombidium deliense]
SSIRRSPKNKRSSSKRRSKKEDNSGISVTSEYSQHLPVHPILPLNSGSSSPPPDTKTPISIAGGQHRSFTIKPIPSPNSKPLLVFINPKSGGNQGSKLMQKFQWLLNPRQVFDLTQGGPKPGLELYKKVPNLRILACGGDGTAGWILSMLDDIGIYPNPPLAVLPLGTGNDLARALGWGGGYTDEPVSKILLNIQDGEVVQLDRWDLKVTRNNDAPVCDPSEAEGAKEDLPLNVVNNYFSIGVDAHIALEFHEAREAHPERFNSRLRNKMFYGQAGGKDLLQRKWKDLHNYISLECDGVDLTQRLRDLKIHSLLFLNIPSYGGGTRPWGTNSPSFETPRTDDGLIEVIGLTTYQLPLLQAGGHGSCIAQCKSARIITSRTIPMQVDGEPCRLLPTIIELQLRNQANMIAKAKSHTQITHIPLEREVTLEVRKLNLSDYETYHYDKEKLKEVSLQLGKLTINPDLELDRLRTQINVMVHGADYPGVDVNDSEAKRHLMEANFALSADWCFVDSCTAERFFRIDRAQEHLHYVVDICNDDLFILDPADDSLKDETVNPVTNCLPESQETINLQNLNSLNENNNNSILLCPPAESSDECKLMDSDANDNKTGGEQLQVSNVSVPDSSTNNAVNVSEGDKSAIKFNSEGKRDEEEWSRKESVSSKMNAAPVKPVRVEKVTTEIIDAAKRGDLQRIKALLEEGYSLLAIDENGMTALHYAAKYGFDEMVQLLVREEHSIIDIPDCEEGQTALHKAAKHGRRKTCCILAAAGCSLSKVDNQGFTAKQLAMQSRDNDLAAYLQHFENYQNTLREKETTV